MTDNENQTIKKNLVFKEWWWLKNIDVVRMSLRAVHKKLLSIIKNFN